MNGEQAYTNFDGPKRILIVDDERSIRLLLQAALEQHGYRTVLAENAAKARLYISNSEPMLILCDVNLPGESGLSLVRDVLGSGARIPVIMVSGIDDPEIGSKALEYGAYGYLVKPLGITLLLVTIENALRRCWAECQAQAYREHLEQILAERTHQLESVIANLRGHAATRNCADEHLQDEPSNQLSLPLHHNLPS
jgi:cyclic di-GMP phosphodiesterase